MLHKDTCRSGGEARRDGSARAAWTSRTNPHHLILTLQTNDLVFMIFSDFAAAYVLTPCLDLHTCVDLMDQSHVWSCLILQHPPPHKQSRLLRMASTSEGNNFYPYTQSIFNSTHCILNAIHIFKSASPHLCSISLFLSSCRGWCCGLYARSQAWLLHVARLQCQVPVRMNISGGEIKKL